MVDGALGQPNGAGGDQRAAGIECFHRHLETFPTFGADTIGLGYEGTVEKQRTGRNASGPHLVLMGADGQPGGVAVDDEQVDTQRRAVFGHGLGRDQDEVGDVGVGAPDLRAVEQVAAVGAACSGLDTGDIGPALWLGDRQRAAQVAASQPWQQTLLLLFGAAGQDGAERGPLDDQQVAGVVADSTQFLDRYAGRQQAVGAAVLGGEGQGEQAQLLE
ncbi:hypothetical protein D9M68_741310 [compost metagenome]